MTEIGAAPLTEKRNARPAVDESAACLHTSTVPNASLLNVAVVTPVPTVRFAVGGALPASWPPRGAAPGERLADLHRTRERRVAEGDDRLGRAVADGHRDRRGAVRDVRRDE